MDYNYYCYLCHKPIQNPNERIKGYCSYHDVVQGSESKKNYEEIQCVYDKGNKTVTFIVIDKST